MSTWSWIAGLVEAAVSAFTAGSKAWSETRSYQRTKSPAPPADRAAEVDARIDAERAAAKNPK